MAELGSIQACAFVFTRALLQRLLLLLQLLAGLHPQVHLAEGRVPPLGEGADLPAQLRHLEARRSVNGGLVKHVKDTVAKGPRNKR